MSALSAFLFEKDAVDLDDALPVDIVWGRINDHVVSRRKGSNAEAHALRMPTTDCTFERVAGRTGIPIRDTASRRDAQGNAIAAPITCVARFVWRERLFLGAGEQTENSGDADSQLLQGAFLSFEVILDITIRSAWCFVHGLRRDRNEIANECAANSTGQSPNGRHEEKTEGPLAACVSASATLE